MGRLGPFRVSQILPCCFVVYVKHISYLCFVYATQAIVALLGPSPKVWGLYSWGVRPSSRPSVIAFLYAY